MDARDLKIGRIYVIAGMGLMRLAELPICGYSCRLTVPGAYSNYWAAVDDVIRECRPHEVPRWAERLERAGLNVAADSLRRWAEAIEKEEAANGNP